MRKKTMLSISILTAAMLGTTPLASYAAEVRVVQVQPGEGYQVIGGTDDVCQQQISDRINSALANIGGYCPEVTVPEANTSIISVPAISIPDICKPGTSDAGGAESPGAQPPSGETSPDTDAPAVETPDNSTMAPPTVETPDTPDNGTATPPTAETPDMPDNGTVAPPTANTPDNGTVAPPTAGTPDNGAVTPPDADTSDSGSSGAPGNENPGAATPEEGTPDEAEASYAEQILELVNEERAKAGLPALKLQADITAAANVRAREIKQSFSHTRPDGSSFSSVLKEQGISFRGSGENIAYGQRTPQQVMEGWMNSDGHRANILNEKFENMGVGYYQDERGVNYWVQLFTY